MINWPVIAVKKNLKELLENAETLLEVTKSDSFSPENPRGIAYYNLQATVRRIRDAQQQTSLRVRNKKRVSGRPKATPGSNQEAERGEERKEPEAQGTVREGIVLPKPVEKSGNGFSERDSYYSGGAKGK